MAAFADILQSKGCANFKQAINFRIYMKLKIIFFVIGPAVEGAV
jgi:hypothetical protein